MKKVLGVILITLLLVGCSTKEEKELKVYNNYVEELEGESESTKKIPFNIEIKVNKLAEKLYSYTALIDKEELIINDLEAILIHDKKTENMFPSIGIFDEKISLDKDSDMKGIKLTGYIENTSEIEFKLLLKYKDENNKNKKYIYVYNYRQE